jgi:hypothetical protein
VNGVRADLSNADYMLCATSLKRGSYDIYYNRTIDSQDNKQIIQLIQFWVYVDSDCCHVVTSVQIIEKSLLQFSVHYE